MPTTRVLKALLDAGATHVRTGKHEIWRFPNGKKVTLSCSPGCPFAEKHQLGDIKRAMKK